MTTIIFLATVVAILVFILRLLIRIFQGKNIMPTVKIAGCVILGYWLLWTAFYFAASDKIMPMGTDVCFDDWCATVQRTEVAEKLGNTSPSLPGAQFIIVHIRMSNHARGIAQKPSEPRVTIINDQGDRMAQSIRGQQAIGKLRGKQIPIDQRLELHQAIETQVVFEIAKEQKNLKVLIEEGPFLTKLLFNEDRVVFLIPQKR